MVVDAKWADLSIPETPDLLGFSHTAISEHCLNTIAFTSVAADSNVLHSHLLSVQSSTFGMWWIGRFASWMCSCYHVSIVQNLCCSKKASLPLGLLLWFSGERSICDTKGWSRYVFALLNPILRTRVKYLIVI